MAGKRPSVTVRLLGPPRIERGPKPVRVDTRKALALVAYLALARRPAARDEVAALLWPESDQVKARAALRRTLSALHAGLGGAGLRIEGDTLALDADLVTVDVSEFRRLAAEDTPQSLHAAVDIARGDFLTGFSLRDSPSFDDWQIGVADEIRRELSSVLERLVDATPNVDAALPVAQRWLSVDELHEPAHRALMRLYAAKGDRSSALRAYRDCVAVLERELGVEPLEETTELYEAIREDRAPMRHAVAPAFVPGPRGELPLVGRSGEIDALVAAYNAIDDDGRLVVVGGEPGIGKTRLVTAFLETISQRGAEVLTARCHPEEERLAFGTITELLRSAPRDSVSSDASAEASRLVPEFGSAPDDGLDTPAARRRLFDAIAEIVSHADVVFVDDVHWTDTSSRDALRFLVRRLRGRRLFVIFTWRTDDVPPAHPLRRMFGEAARDGLATGITLGRLLPSDVEELARAVGATQDVATRLYEESAGVPFFVSEYLAALRSGTGEGLPTGVRDLISSRVGAVGRMATQVLTAAAVIGRAIDTETVRDTSGRSDDEVAEGLEELVAHGLLLESDDHYDFSHPKLREFVYDNATHARRRLLHGRAADALMRSVRRRPELAALAAHHAERAGRESDASDMYVAAGDHARSIYANAEALEHYRSAVALGHAKTAQLHEWIGDLLTLEGRYRDAIAAFETSIALGGDEATVEAKLGDVHHRLGDFEGAETHFAEALLLAKRRAERARVFADRALNAHRAGWSDRAGSYASSALDEAEGSRDARAKARAHNVAGILASGDDSARVHLEASLAIAEKLDDPIALVAALNNLALASRSDDVDRALELAQRALDLCARIGDRHREAALHSNVADLLRAARRGDEAMEHLKTSAAIFRDVGEPDELHPEIWKLVEW